MPGKGKGKQKKKQQPPSQASKAAKTVKQPEQNEFDSDIENKDDDVVDLEADEDTVGNGEQEDVTVKSKVPEDKQSAMKDTTEVSEKLKLEDDKSKLEHNVVEENGAVGNSPSEKKLTRKEMKKMKRKACKLTKVNYHY